MESAEEVKDNGDLAMQHAHTLLPANVAEKGEIFFQQSRMYLGAYTTGFQEYQRIRIAAVVQSMHM
jgi:hypothetical protein